MAVILLKLIIARKYGPLTVSASVNQAPIDCPGDAWPTGWLNGGEHGFWKLTVSFHAPRVVHAS